MLFLKVKQKFKGMRTRENFSCMQVCLKSVAKSFAYILLSLYLLRILFHRGGGLES
jgi:hypothetical protein